MLMAQYADLFVVHDLQSFSGQKVTSSVLSSMLQSVL